MFTHFCSRISSNTKTFLGITALHMAVESGNLELVQYLESQGAEVNATDVVSHCFPLFLKKKLSFFFSWRLQGNKLFFPSFFFSRFKDGWSPLHLSCSLGKPEIFHFLISKGADVNAQTKEGEYTLELADTPEMKEAVKAAKGFNREIVSIVYNRPPKPLDDDSEENLSNCSLFLHDWLPP